MKVQAIPPVSFLIPVKHMIYQSRIFHFRSEAGCSCYTVFI